MIFAIYLLCLVAIVYFLLIRPQQKRKKRHAALIGAMSPGVEVVTVGGLHGVLVEKTEQTCIVAVKDGSLLEFDLQAVAKVCSSEAGTGSRKK